MAALASSAENIKCGPRPGVHESTRTSRRSAGIGDDSRQDAASRYGLPSERSLAPNHDRPEPRMVGELSDELLTDHSGRAENAYVDSFASA